MPNVFTNSFKDFIGINRAVLYRTFMKWKWKTPQPMFNIMEIKPGTDDIFDEFLKKSLVLSLKKNTPISFGPYKSEETKTYIYITHYASTPAFMGVCNGLLFHGLSKLRAKATQKTSWTYSSATHAENYESVESIILIGLEIPQEFENYLTSKELKPITEIYPIKDVRGKSLKKYWAFEGTTANTELLDAFTPSTGAMQKYSANKLPS
ncbi:MAG: hypothetical protein ACI8ZM_004904 [Crocinitomix sp.]|jgi:hypothetical protein